MRKMESFEGKKVLHCYSTGDKRFSAMEAKVTMYGIESSIENHYQRAKVYSNGFRPKGWWDVKGKKSQVKGLEVVEINIFGLKLDKKYLSQWYNLLWFTYLHNHPELVEYAKQFDEFLDIYRGKSVNCQADIIKMYVKEGPDKLFDTCEELYWILTNQ